MRSHQVLYSINTRLAYLINEEFYNQIHFVWCCPFFDTLNLTELERNNTPRSSLPKEVYYELYKDVRSNDLHSAKIQSNRIGLMNGAVAKMNQGVITSEQKESILARITQAPLIEFQPLIYVIPYSNVTSLIEYVPIEKRASPSSSELKIPELPRSFFDVITFEVY